MATAEDRTNIEKKKATIRVCRVPTHSISITFHTCLQLCPMILRIGSLSRLMNMEKSHWEEAANNVPMKWQEQLRSLSDLSCGPSVLLDSVFKEQADCRAKQWQCRKPNGHKVYVRDILEKVAFWVDKVKEAGDIIVQFDPVHACLPWAGVRFLLTAATSDMNKYGAMLESIEAVVSAISRYTLIEQIYCGNSASEACQQLCQSVVQVYSAILVFLCKAKRFFAQNAAQRIALSFVQLGKDADELTRDIVTKDAAVEKLRSIVDGERARSTLESVESLQGEMLRIRSDAQSMKSILLDLENPMIQISTRLVCMQDGLDKEERRKIMRWLSTEQYIAHHRTIARTRLPGSGEWVFHKFEYQRWRKSSQFSLLWLHGDPGAGKSVLVSLVIDQISEELRGQANPPPLAYFYCTRESSEPKRANPTEIMLSILKQLSCKNDNSPILAPVVVKWEERLSQGSEHRLDMDECVDVILELTKERPAIIVIDALDECQRETRSELLEGLDRILQESEHLVKVFVSSRRDPDIRNHFRKTPKLEIAARENSEDIENYITSELNKKIAAAKFLNGQPSEELVADVKAELVARAEGIFRWVSASIQTLCDPSMQLEEDIRLALERLPPTLQGVYAIIIAQIHKGAPVSTPLAKKALKWLLCAQQPLHSDELLKALSADLDVSNAKITVENLLNICCNLVKYDSELDVVRFIHLSVREYLEKEPEYEPSLSHSAVAIACLRACIHGAKPKRKGRHKNTQNKTFYDYAIVYWPLHCVHAGTYRQQGKLCKLFYDFIYDTKTYSGWLWSMLESWDEMGLETIAGSPEAKLLEQLTDCRSRWPSPIFLACAFGFMELLQDGRDPQENDEKKKNVYNRDPFHVAVRHGQHDVVEYLATSSGQEGADEGSLIAAVSMNHKKMVSYLLEKNPQLSITHRVIEVGVGDADVDTVKLLLTKIDRVEVTTGLINLAAENGLDGKQIIDLLLNLGQDVSIADQTIEKACSNRKHGLSILETLLSRNMDSTITEEAVEYAAANEKCGFALLNALFHRASHLEVTSTMIEAACRCSTLEPLQFLLGKNKAVSISYDSLVNAASNEEVGDQMLLLLLDRCKPTLLDEWLLQSAMINRKFGVEITKLLLAKAGGTILPVTMDILGRAAGNEYIGETLVEEFLKDARGWKLHPDVATAAAQNRYCPVEVLTLILKTDEGLKFTTDTIIAAAQNPHYALELLDFILSHDPSIKITPEVIKAAAGNDLSGADVIEFLWRLGPFPITPAAFEAAGQNRLCGDKILNIWLRNKSGDIPPVAVEAAMTNVSLGPEILRLLLQTGRVEVSPKAVEHAAANEIYGPTLIAAIFRHQGKIEITEELLLSGTANEVTGSKVLEILLSHGGSARVTPFVIEAAASKAAASKSDLDNITTLLSAAQPLSVTSKAVQYALKGSRNASTLLKCFLGKNPELFLEPETFETIIENSKTADVAEIFEFLGKCGKDVKMSEMVIKRAVRRSMSLLLVLVDHCERRHEAVPITQEIIEESVRNTSTDAPAMLEYLLQKLLDRGEKIQISERLVATAVKTSWAGKALEILSEFNGGIIPTSPTIIQLAVINPKLSNSIIEKFLGFSPRQLKDLCSTEATIIVAIKRLKPSRGLKKWLLSLQKPIQITQNILETAAGSSVGDLALILDILQIQGQESQIPSLLSPRVFQVAQFPQLFLLRRKLREHGHQMPITSGVMLNMSSRRPGLNLASLKLKFTILREQGQESELPKLITDEVVLEAVKSRSSVQVLTLLKDTLGTEKFCGLFSEAHLMTAAGAADIGCVNLLYPLIASSQPKQYYEDIVAFNDAVFGYKYADVRKLFARKVFPNARTHFGEPLLSSVIQYRDLMMFHLMLEYPEVDLNSTNVDGQTPLFAAAAVGRTIFVRPLLNRGADRSIKDKDGKTAEDIAVEAGNYMIAKLIRDFGTTQQEEIANKYEPPTAGMERFSLMKSMTL